MKTKKKIVHKPLYKQAPYIEDGLRPILGGVDPELNKFKDNPPKMSAALEAAYEVLLNSDLSIFENK
jgi:hypothetical protein